MTNSKALKEAIKNAGVKITHIADVLGCSRNRVYSIINGADCTATEITLLTRCLHLTKDQRDFIFFTETSE